MSGKRDQSDASGLNLGGNRVTKPLHHEVPPARIELAHAV